MRHLPIILKFFTVLGLFGLCTVGAAFYATAQMRVIGARYSQLVEGEDAATLLVSRANRNLQAAANAVANLEISGTDDENTAAMKALNEAGAKFFSYMKQAAAAAPDAAPAIGGLMARAHDVIDNACGNAVALGIAAEDPPDSAVAQQDYIKNCLPAFTAAIAAVTAQTQAMATLSTQRDALLRAATTRTILVTLIGMIGGILVVTGFSFVAINGWVIAPIKTLQAAMGRLAAGDLQTRVAGAGRRDEIGGMARAVDVFKQAGLDRLAAERAAETHREAAAALQAQAEAERAAAAAMAARTVSALAAGLENLAAGALAYRLTSPFGETYEKLRIDFNAAMDRLHATMQAIADNTAGVREGAGEMTRATDDLSRRTEQQAASLEETAAALDEITAAVTAAADGAAQAGRAAAAAKTEAENSAGIVTETVSAMSAIEESSRRIGSIIGVIDEIAFQTNLLALNAGVEAARAGDAGRGFAVVATEVRALAQRSADAAKEIKALIATSGRQVAEGVTLVGETGAALGRIMALVANLDAQVAAIAGSAKEQATGLKEVNAAINQMDQVTQQNAAMVEQTSAASHAMADEAAALAALVEQFSIDEPPRREFSAMESLKQAAAPRALPAAAFGRFKNLPGQ